MTAATFAPAPIHARTTTEPTEQSVVLHAVDWTAYCAIDDVLGNRHDVRVVYHEGKLVLMTKSRRHEWYADRIEELFKAAANGLGILWESAGETTLRREGLSAGVEPDAAFYVGAHAQLMRGPTNVDLEVQPPPDVTIEVELTHSAEQAMAVYSKLGVPEVWRFDAGTGAIAFWVRAHDGAYAVSPTSRAIHELTVEDVRDQLRAAEETSVAQWFAALPGWVETTLRPRVDRQG
ncbi:MAG: Uma2 family endonuclease [Isosphaeraceae bacterium]|nr:Uma2 family endonuclease [Isosphaeraceae bacterium]